MDEYKEITEKCFSDEELDTIHFRIRFDYTTYKYKYPEVPENMVETVDRIMSVFSETICTKEFKFSRSYNCEFIYDPYVGNGNDWEIGDINTDTYRHESDDCFGNKIIIDYNITDYGENTGFVKAEIHNRSLKEKRLDEYKEMIRMIIDSSYETGEEQSGKIGLVRKKAAELLKEQKKFLSEEDAARKQKEIEEEAVRRKEEEKKRELREKRMKGGKDVLDDITFVREITHTTSGPWHLYDVLIAAAGYGWRMMIDWAQYMSTADIDSVSEVTVGDFGASQNITEEYLNNKSTLSGLPELEEERGTLSIAGTSKTLRMPLKMLWFNQTRLLRFVTMGPVDEEIMERYAETVIRRTFGTKDEMKLAKPLPENG